ncbi:hypothetical protein [Asticcacaulis tiandongensis]|uniref:hypothetical protein n=1 Tax=Asticcacaulis tiandongensis TaxID=2565365 RepID=UPI00112D2749|nr:hypothetical protein [Asticcacaulis tiandongensis]
MTDSQGKRAGKLPEHKRVLIRQVVKAMPVQVLLSLERALGLTEDALLGDVHDIVSLELESHDIKAMIFRPFMPMFERREDGLSGVHFPVWVLDNLWKALERHQTALFARLHITMRGFSQSDPVPPVFTELVDASAQMLRQRPELMLPEGHDADDQALIAEFAAYLDIYHTAREAIRKMPEWLGRLTADKAVAIRILFKDAGRLAEDGGLRWLEVVFANLEDGADIMAFVGIASDRANDRFLSQSELAVFGERVLEAAEGAQRRLMPLIRTPDRLAEAAEMALQALHLTQTMETAIELTRDGPWGQRVARIRQAVAAQVESQIERLQPAIERALPTKAERHHGRVVGATPIVGAVSEPAMAEVLGVTGFCHHIGAGAAQGGYAVRLNQCIEAGEAYLEAYLEAALALYADADADQQAVISAQLEALICLTGALCGTPKANLARRRVASLGSGERSKTVA